MSWSCGNVEGIRNGLPKFVVPGVWLSIAVLVIGFSGCCVPRHPVESALVLQDIGAGQKPSPLKRRTPEPIVRTVFYRSGNHQDKGDLYLLPGRPPGPGMILVPGVAKAGYRDSRIVNLARTLARAQFTVLVPDLENVRQLKVSAEDAEEIAAAAQYLLSQPDMAPAGRVGIGAASYALGPAIIASLQPELCGRIGFILGIGGYYDVEEALTFAVTGFYRDRTQRCPRWRCLKPDEQVKLVFLVSNIERLSSPVDREILRNIVRKKLQNHATPIDGLTARLGKEGSALYRLLTAKQPAQVPELIRNLPPRVRREVARLNLANRDLSTLQAQLILIHGRYDRSVPFTESKSLADVAPKARLFLVNNLAHVDIGKGNIIDVLRLWCAVDELLSQRDRIRVFPRRSQSGIDF